ncbi:MAG: hypothetical protein DRP45_03355 [Candidatus Zixiibacteriota bacterium]|nr:MAG: hypothetical protein DRP45_03355 [candidate division Zixibacteria bacterium]
MVKSINVTPLPVLAVFVILLSLMAGAVFADAGHEKIEAGSDWCGTMKIWEQTQLEYYGKVSKDCAAEGSCDYPIWRDPWIPEVDDAIMYVRLVVHVLAEDDGSNVITDSAETWAQIDNLNAAYAPWRIQFLAEVDQINSSQWRILDENEQNTLKNNTAWNAGLYLNVWATEVTFNYSYGTFPWSPNAQSSTGGVIMGHFHWEYGLSSTFPHEVGHCFGLWHPFHGVTEVGSQGGPCGTCGEYPGCPNPDMRGDLCEDTPPTPLVEWCGDAGGNSTCGDQLPYGYTMPENYMGYTPNECRTMFTPQQGGRMRCWLDDALDSWVIPFNITPEEVFGPAPLEVQFDAITHKTPTSWDWDFDEGEISHEQSPFHTFADPGHRTITVDLHTSGDSYQRDYPHLISAYADTMKVAEVSGAVGQDVRVDINVHNYLELKTLTIPFHWADGPLLITKDSVVTTGLRTDYFELKTQLNDWPGDNRCTWELTCSNSGSQPYLAPGDGPVLSIWFSVDGGSGGCPVDIEGYIIWEPGFTTYPGMYTPEIINGGFGSGCCLPPSVGDLDQSSGEIGFNYDGADLSLMINGLFIDPTNGWDGICLDEADVDFSAPGRPVEDPLTIDGADLSVLIDALFVNPAHFLPSCDGTPNY